MPRTYNPRYGQDHKLERARWKPVVDSGQAKCARCGGVIAPGSKWALDHADNVGQSGIYLGVSHVRCNTAASNPRYRDPAPTSNTKW